MSRTGIVSAVRGLLIGIVLACAGPVSAQETTATLMGVVKDESGAVLPGVDVTVHNVNTGIDRTVTTDSAGAYLVPVLPPGTYEVKVALQGFKTEVRGGITLAISQKQVINFSLGVGQLQESVLVTEAAPLVQTTSSAVAGLVDTRQIRDLPLNGRSFEQLATLQPGVVAINTAGRNASQGQGRKISIAGARPTQISFLLDGTDINDMFNNTPGSASGNMLGVDTVREFVVVASTYSAEYGRSAGGTVNAVTRSGTNNLHGSAFEFHRDSKFDAPNYFDRGDTPPPFTRDQFGFTLGGPVLRNRTFFFGGFEGLRERLSLSGVASVPSADARRGLLPGTAPIAIDSAVARVLALYPLPNGKDLGGGIGQYLSSPTKPTDERFFIGKIDHRVSDRDSLVGRYNFDKANSVRTDNLGVFKEVVATKVQYLMGEETHLFSSALLNTLRVAFNRSKSQQYNTAIAENIPYLTPSQTVIGVAFGPIDVTGLESIGTGGTNPKDATHDLIEVNDSVFFTRGAHSMKFGANAKIYRIHYVSEFTVGGRYRFTNLANLLRGQPQRLEVQMPGSDSLRLIRQKMFGFYGQDDWKVNERLSLNLGLRYEFVTTPAEADGKIGQLVDPVRDAALTIGKIFENPSLRNFAPRVGFAWDPSGNGRSSIRGGVGIFYDELLPSYYRTPLSRVPPFWMQGFVTNPRPFPLNLNSAQLGAGGQRIDIFTYTPEQPTRYQYSVSYQREILPDTVAQVAYVGAKGVHQITPTEANTAIPYTDANGEHYFLVDASGAPLQPVRNPNFRNIRTRFTNGDSRYNSLQIQVQKRYSHGVQVQANYTYAKANDNGTSSVGGTDYSQEEGTPQDPDCVHCDWGLSAYDVRQAFVANFTWDLPLGRDAAGAARSLAGGWQVSGVLTAMKGNPFSPILAFDRAGQITRSGGDAQRPSLRSGANPNAVTGDVDGWIDIAALELPAAGRFGNLPRNSLIGPGLLTVDVALVKNFAFGGERQLQFRLEAFNLLNRANFSVPGDRTVFTGSRVVGGVEQAIVNPSAGLLDSTSTTSRQMQLGVKFLF